MTLSNIAQQYLDAMDKNISDCGNGDQYKRNVAYSTRQFPTAG